MQSRKVMMMGKLSQHYYAQDFVTDDSTQCGEYDLCSASHWSYPSSIKIRKKRRKI